MTLLVLASLPVAAAIQNVEVADSGCAADMTTSGCFSDTTYTYKFNPAEPTIATCTARGTQRCRYCKEIYTANGATYARECGYSQVDASCTCSPQTRGNGCTLTGSCTYTDNY